MSSLQPNLYLHDQHVMKYKSLGVILTTCPKKM